MNSLSYAIYLGTSKKFLEKYDPFWMTGWFFAYGSVGLGLLSIQEWPSFQMPELTPPLVSAVTFALIGGTLLTYGLNNWTLSKVRSSQVALFIYIQPVIAAMIDRVLRAPADADVTAAVRAEVAELCSRFAPYPTA